MAVLGIDLGATKVSYALFDDAGGFMFRGKKYLEKGNPDAASKTLMEVAVEMKAKGNKLQSPVKAVGVCVPGIAWKKTGKVWAPNIPGWEDFPLVEHLKVVYSDNEPVVIESDRGCHLMGEYWCGAAKGKKDAIYLAVGTGIGAGIMCQGELIRGAFDISGAIGWMALKTPYDKKYDVCGCFEYHASGAGLVRVAKELISSGMSSTLSSVNGLKSEHVFEAWFNKDEVAVKTIDQAVEMWGMATANLVSLFNPQLIIFGGGVFGPAIVLLERIYEEAKKWAQPVSIGQVELKSSVLEGDAGLIGAGYLALLEIGKL